jgi:signal transduction histidine kinase
MTSGIRPCLEAAHTIGGVRADKWLDWAAFTTWVLVGVPTFVDLFAGELTAVRAVAWTVMFVLFGAALFDCLRPGSISRSRRVVMMVVQSLTGLTMMYVGVNGVAGAVLVIVAAEAAVTFSSRGAWIWMAAQTFGIAVVVRLLDSWSDTIALAGAYAGFQAFALAAMSLAASERAARESLSRANAELHAARFLLAENSRAAERLRISRDLHDALGHHLTALSLQLDVASRLASDPAAGHVQQAHAITRLLLADVRDVVSQMRGTGRIDLAQGVRALAREDGRLKIHLDMPETLPIDEPDRADALVRCVQEIITNATRHGDAANLWIRIAPQPDGIELHARDDGRGALHLTWGHGLTGMRERFGELSGSIDVTPGVDRGFEVHGFMPHAGTAL